MNSELSFKCGHCDNDSPITIVSEATEYDDAIEAGTRWLILRCASCQEVNVLCQIYEEDIDYETPGNPVRRLYHRKPRYLYPLRNRRFYHLPESVDKAFEVALRTYHVEPIAFAVLVGRTLEFVCKDRNAKGKDLHSMLVDLANRGEIPSIIASIAQGLRFFRNISAHASDVEVSKEDASILRDMCEIILEYVYEAPNMLRNLEERITQLKNAKNSSGIE